MKLQQLLATLERIQNAPHPYPATSTRIHIPDLPPRLSLASCVCLGGVSCSSSTPAGPSPCCFQASLMGQSQSVHRVWRTAESFSRDESLLRWYGPGFPHAHESNSGTRGPDRPTGSGSFQPRGAPPLLSSSLGRGSAQTSGLRLRQAQHPFTDTQECVCVCVCMHALVHVCVQQCKK